MPTVPKVTIPQARILGRAYGATDFIEVHRSEAATAQSLQRAGFGLYQSTDGKGKFWLTATGREMVLAIMKGNG